MLPILCPAYVFEILDGAGGTLRATSEGAGGTHRATSEGAGGTLRATSEGAGGTHAPLPKAQAGRMRHFPYLIGGGGGGTAPNSALNAATVLAACQPLMPAVHTNEFGPKPPPGIMPCNCWIENGPCCWPLTAT